MDIRRRMLFKKKASSSGSYTINLNGQWESTTVVPNPDSTLYDGVYRSTSNYHVGGEVATMYITIKDCSSFKIYIRSYAEGNWDYVMVSQLDQTINGNTSYSNTTLVKAHTRGNQQSGTALSNYTLVEFTGITPGEHTITVLYKKDDSVDSGDDRGYVLIEKLLSGDEGGIIEGPINIENYLTIEALEDGLTASLSANACEYCIDGDGNWQSLDAGSVTQSINIGQTLSFRGNLTPLNTYPYGIGIFTISKKCNLKGNCMSMLFKNLASDNFSLSGKSYAFYQLFYNCTNIVTVSDNFLPATTVAYCCYCGMFQNCTSLTKVPTLPATILDATCYGRMFRNCTSLINAPELPATTLAEYCYDGMFEGCTNLTNVPAILPAMTLKNYCYRNMFYLCTSLTTVPYLPAFTLITDCYNHMFYGCTSLTTAPELPATRLTSYCYYYMFYGCSKLNYIKMLATDISASNCLTKWVSGVASIGTFVKSPAMTSLPTASVYNDYVGVPSGWTVVDNAPITIDNYLTIEALENGLTASLSVNVCEYCVDGDNNWKRLTAGTATESINSGQTLSFRGALTPDSSNGIGTFTISKRCNLKGNCMSMLFGDNSVNNYSLSGKSYAFYRLFNGCNTIVNVDENFLPATTLASSCYRGMFMNCSNLINSPNLPAETVYDYSYGAMFQNCTSLVTAPIMLAKYLGNYSCLYMFYNCQLLTTAPVLYPSTLTNYCYRYMFGGCTKLNYIKMLATNISANDCLEHWVDDVAYSGTFVKSPAMNSLPTGTDGIPEGWTVVNDGEESGGNIITFTIDGTAYQAEEGMTWGEWVDSEYNVNGRFFLDFDDSIMDHNTNWWIGTVEYYVFISDIIQEGYNYVLVA